MIKRIRSVVGNAAYNARRTAQTERTRVQSQARNDACTEAAEQGVPVVQRWSCQFLPGYHTKRGRSKGSCESHKALDGQMQPVGTPFHTIWGNDLMYPGDPSAPAREVINCHCVLVPEVGTGEGSGEKGDAQQKTGENVDNSGQSDIISTRTTAHASERMSERSVSDDEANDAVRNPIHIKPVVYDQLGRKSQIIIGRSATVCINPDTGKIITLWKTGIKTRKKYEGGN